MRLRFTYILLHHTAIACGCLREIPVGRKVGAGGSSLAGSPSDRGVTRNKDRRWTEFVGFVIT